jgi:hypothetical protein
MEAYGTDTAQVWVIVDTPPVLAIADAGIIAECCDEVRVVVRAGETAHDSDFFLAAGRGASAEF